MDKETIEQLFRQKNMEGYLMASVRNRCLNLLEYKDVRAKFENAYTLEMKQNAATDDDAISYTSVEQWYQQMMTFAKRNLSEQTLRVFRMM